MNKNRRSILFFCVVILALTSCENFLKGADTKTELDRLIAEANAPTVEIYIAAEKDAGSLAPTGILSYKLGKTFNILFTPENGYEFLRWQAVDRITQKELNDVVYFENPNSPETRAQIKQDISNIQIKPVYIELPRVVSYNPAYSDYGSFANSAITFEFNTPMVRDGTDISFDFNNITITSGGENISSKFYNPELLEDKKTLQVKPRAQELTDYMGVKGLENLEIRVALNCESIDLLLSGKEYKLNEGKTVGFKYKIRNEIETNPPARVEGTELVVSKNAISLETAALAQTKIPLGTISTAVNEVTREQVMARNTGSYVYIYGKYRDDESGLLDLEVQERITNKSDGKPYYTSWVKGNIIERNICKNDDGSVEYCLKYEFASSDGAIILSISPVDYCGNRGTEELCTIFKNTDKDISSLCVYNLTDRGFKAESGLTYLPIEILKTEFDTKLKTININDLNAENNGFKCQVYGNCYYEADEIDIYYNFDKTGYKKMTYYPQAGTNADSSKFGIWKAALNANTIDGKALTIKVIDKNGSEFIKETSFPGIPQLQSVKTVSNQVTHTTNKFAYYISDKAFTYVTRLDVYDNDNTKYKFTPETNSRGDSAILNSGYYSYVVLHNENLAGPVSENSLNSTVPDSQDGTASFSVNKPVKTSAGAGTGEYTINVTLNEDAWTFDDNNEYDLIFLMAGTGAAMDIVIFFEKPSVTCTFNVPTKKIWKNDLNIKVWGVKDGASYGPATGKVDKIKSSNASTPEFINMLNKKDNANPYFEVVEAELDNNLYYSYDYSDTLNILDGLRVTDDESGVTGSRIKWKIGDNPVWYSYSDFVPAQYNTSYYYLPVWDIDESVVLIEAQASDKNSNKATGTYITNFQDDVPVIKPYINSSNDSIINYELRTDYVKDDWYKWKYMIWQYDQTCENWEETDSYKNWEKMDTYDPDDEEYFYEYTPPVSVSSTESGYKEYNFGPVTLPKNNYYKIVTCADKVEYNIYDMNKPGSSFEKVSCAYGISSPYYFYSGERSTGESTDYLIQAGTTPQLSFIGSDQPVLVQTIITKKPYNECKNWDVEKWFRRHKILNEVVLSFSPSDKNYKSYFVNKSEIPDGFCYVVVAHFANGKIQMSEVGQK